MTGFRKVRKLKLLSIFPETTNADWFDSKTNERIRHGITRHSVLQLSKNELNPIP
jgi:hypothetical protein